MNRSDEHSYAQEQLCVSASLANRGLYAFLLTFFLLLTYAGIPLFITDSFYVPLLVFLIPVLLVVFQKRIYRYDVMFVLKIIGVLMLTVFLSPGISFIGDKLKGVLQTTVSITAGILLLKLVDVMGKRSVQRVLLGLCIVLLVGSFLEVIGVLRGTSDAFRAAVDYRKAGFGVYGHAERDLGLVGFTRPNFFASEPSILAIGFFAFINSWLLLSYSRKNFILACLGTLGMLFLSGSPILLMSLLISVFTMVALTSKTHEIGYLICLLLLTITLAFFLRPELIIKLAMRFSYSFSSANTYALTSENVRMIFPYITLVDVLKNSPLFGLGISGKKLVQFYSSLPVKPVHAFGNNSFAAFFAYMGVVGSFLFLKTFLKYLHKLKISNSMLLMFILLGLAQVMGAFEASRFWGYVFLFVAVLKKRHETVSDLYPALWHKTTQR